MNSAELLQFVASGLQNGAVYALVALGFTLVYASTGIINFAQGEFFMLGGMLAVAGVRAGLPLPFAALASVVLTASIGLLFERVALRPRRDSGPTVLIIITIGGSMVMKSLARHAFGPNELSLPPFSPGVPIVFAGASIDRQVLWIWGLTIVAVVALTFLYSKTKLGRAMRACSLSHDAARLMGIDTARVVMISFGLAAALGALGGVAVAPLTQTAFDVGSRAGLKGFAAAILGGLGNPIAAVVGGLVLGLLESLSVAFISSTYKDAISLVVLLAVLFLRPQGLLGKSRREKV
ncbi:MAG: branched-chain amino acid ABC transporter permease [Actinomycetota bacterium]|nr:MAG: branched-chain amino acid transport system permease [Actinomycetota bacterium]MDP3631183.1 branched-chain amino acid ABC transporter permease [Actinomycetota bacterium]